MTTLDEHLENRPVNEARVAAILDEMNREHRAFHLRELRERAGLTQAAVAEILGVGQNRVSQMESAAITSTRVETLQRYADALGVELVVSVRTADGTEMPLVTS